MNYSLLSCLSLLSVSTCLWAADSTPSATQPTTVPDLIYSQPVTDTTLPHPKPLINKELIHLYHGSAPDALGNAFSDTPQMQVFLPPANVKRLPTAVIVLPGGGYSYLAEHEGTPPAKWLAQNGITAFVLYYRYGMRYHHPVELNDAQRALRYVRAHAGLWQLDPHQIGIMGFSAGGHLAATAATHFTPGDLKAKDPLDFFTSRPDFQILLYPVISMGPVGHESSRICLLGEHPTPELISLLSNEKQVTSNTPPAFIMHSEQDHIVPIENSHLYAAALKKANVPYETLFGPFGEHGCGVQDFWTKPCLKWLLSLPPSTATQPASHKQ